jgi:hypothetical protein
MVKIEENYPLLAIQPSQLYLNEEKLAAVKRLYLLPGGSLDHANFPPLPIKSHRGRTFFTDGHHKAYVAYLAGKTEITVEWDEDNLDWTLYDKCVDWCEERQLWDIRALAAFILPPVEYKTLWIGRCQALHDQIHGTE